MDTPVDPLAKQCNCLAGLGTVYGTVSVDSESNRQLSPVLGNTGALSELARDLPLGEPVDVRRLRECKTSLAGGVLQGRGSSRRGRGGGNCLDGVFTV